MSTLRCNRLHAINRFSSKVNKESTTPCDEIVFTVKALLLLPCRKSMVYTPNSRSYISLKQKAFDGTAIIGLRSLLRKALLHLPNGGFGTFPDIQFVIMFNQ